MVTRTGPFIMAAEQWDEPYAATLERVDRHCRDVGAIALYYDAGGSGAGIRTNMRQMWRDRQLTQYPVFGVNFGAAVEGANTEFVRGQTNAQYFARRNSQLAWTLRLRAARTKRLMEEIDRVGAGMYKGRPKDSSEPLGSPAERGRGSTDPDAPNNRQGDTR